MAEVCIGDHRYIASEHLISLQKEMSPIITEDGVHPGEHKHEQRHRLRSPTCPENYQQFDFAESKDSARTGSSAGEGAKGLLEGSDITRVPLGDFLTGELTSLELHFRRSLW